MRLSLATNPLKETPQIPFRSPSVSSRGREDYAVCDTVLSPCHPFGFCLSHRPCAPPPFLVPVAFSADHGWEAGRLSGVYSPPHPLRNMYKTHQKCISSALLGADLRFFRGFLHKRPKWRPGHDHFECVLRILDHGGPPSCLSVYPGGTGPT